MPAAVVKNHEPTKHSAFVAPAPARRGNPGTVASAKNDDPIANSRHCRSSVANRAVIADQRSVDAYSSDRIRSPTSLVESFGVAAGGQVLADGLVDPCRGVGLADVA